MTSEAVPKDLELNEAVLNGTARHDLFSEFPEDEQRLLAMKSHRDVARLYAAYHLADNEVRRNAPGRRSACPALLAEALIDRRFLKEQLHAILRGV